MEKWISEIVIVLENVLMPYNKLEYYLIYLKDVKASCYWTVFMCAIQFFSLEVYQI